MIDRVLLHDPGEIATSNPSYIGDWLKWRISVCNETGIYCFAKSSYGVCECALVLLGFSI